MSGMANPSGKGEQERSTIFPFQVPSTGKKELGCCSRTGREAAANIHCQEARTSGREHAGRDQAGTSQDT